MFIATLICLLSILIFWLSNKKQPTAILKTQPQVTKKNSSDPVLNTPVTVNLHEVPQEKKQDTPSQQRSEKTYTEEDCWTIVKKQYVSNPTFTLTHINTLNTVVGPWYYSNQDLAPTQENSVSGKFLLALGRSGLLTGKIIRKNIPEAIKLLNEVILEDPQNSAPRIFLAITLSKNGAQDKVQNILNQIETQTTFFNSYTLNFTKILFKQIKTPEDLMAAYGVWEHTALVNYDELGQFLKKHKLGKVAEQLLADGLSEKKIAEDIDWLTIEYAIGKNVLNKISPENKYPDWKSTYQSKRTKYLSELGHASINGTCNLNVLNEHVQLLPNYL